MAVNTTLATIQMRRGLEQDFDAEQLTAGEWAVSTDKKYVRMCFFPGLVVRMATYEAFEEDMKQIQDILAECEDIQVAVDAMAKLAEQHKNAAAASATAAAGSATSAESSATTATQKATEAATSATNAANSEETATQKANAAGTSAANAANSATSASNSAKTATEKATAAANSAASAASSASTATSKASDASASAANADTYAKKSQSYAVGGTGTREGEDSDNAKYYYEQSRNISQGLSGTLIPMGTVNFANLPALSDVDSGWMYNVSEQFTTTAEFNEGAGKVIPAGANVYKTADGKWDVLAGTPVTTVNGKTGNVEVNLGNITGTLPIYKGGTGEATAQDAFDALANGTELGADNVTLTDDTLFVTNADTNIDSYRRRKIKAIWEYIKSKVESLFVKKSGDTMNGDLCIEKASGETGFRAKRTDTDTEVLMGIGASGDNHGVWSTTLDKWIAYATKSNGEIRLNGLANEAEKARLLKSKGVVSPEEAEKPSEHGLTMMQAYNNGYPIQYGNVISATGNGSSQLLLGWSGYDGGIARIYYRNHRDLGNEWSPWKALAWLDDVENLKKTVTKDENGLVPAGSGHANQVFGTDADGNPGWMDKAGGVSEEFLSENYVKKQGGNISNTISSFAIKDTRVLPSGGLILSENFGRIKKYLADLNTIAFSGKYDDITSLPFNYIYILEQDAFDATFSGEYFVYPSFGTSFVLCYHTGGNSTLNTIGADDREVLWLMSFGHYASSDTSGKNSPLRIITLATRGSTSRGTLTAISDTSHENYSFKITIPKGSIATFNFFAVGHTVNGAKIYKTS